MKKLLSLLLVPCFLFSLAGCGDIADSSSAEKVQQIENIISETASSDPQPEQSDGDWGTFQKNASLTETVMVDEGGVKITAVGLNYTNYSAELELTIENNSGKDLSFSSGTMGYSCNSINGYMVEDGYLHCSVADGKKANESISFSYDGLMLYGIREVGSVSLSLSQRDSDGNVVADKTPVEIAVPGLKAEYDAGGDDVYNNGGLRIAAKTVLEDPSDYSSAMYVLLLAENKSGKTLAIDAVYDSISVNGFMTDGLCDSRELADGECAAIEIMLLESSLEANKITSVSDIEEIEIGMEIKEEGSSIDEPVIHIVWN